MVTLNRPEKLNSIDLPTAAEIAAVLHKVAQASEVRAVVLTGAGRAFSAGGDMKTLDPGDSPVESKEIIYGYFGAMIRSLRSIRVPVIAAVNGPAVGAGCELALACDFRFASENARFGEVWIRLGLIPALGGTYLLPRLVGLEKALELILTGRFVDAEEAARIGLVSKVFPQDLLLPEAKAFAKKLAAGPSLALQAAKEAVYRGLNSSFAAELEILPYIQSLLRTTADHREGVRAFLEKREPCFLGK